MTSLQTNIAALTALQALKSTNAELAETQNRISSGYRVASASDNAAYWSIATTMRSDNKALSAVRDSLGLGSALVDTAYQGLSTSADLISEFKSKLALAKTEGVDRAKVQAELNQLKSQIQSVASSSTFSGVNWLSTNHSENLKQTDGFSADIVSSAFRSKNGIDIGTIGVRLNDISLINSGGGGILQKDPDYFKDLGGFINVSDYVVGHDGHDNYHFTGPATLTSSDAINFDITVDSSPYSFGITTPVIIDRSTVDSALGLGAGGSISTSDEWKAVLEYAFVSYGITATTSAPNHEGGDINIRSAGSWAYGSSVTISNIVSTLPLGFAFGLENGPHLEHDNTYPMIEFEFTTPFEIPDDGAMYFDWTIYDLPNYVSTFPIEVKIERTDINILLGKNDGVVASAEELAKIIYLKNGHDFIAKATGNTVEISLDPTSHPAYGKDATPFYIGNVRTTQGYVLPFSLEEVDITSANADIDEYIVGIDHMEKTIIAAASRLGAVQNRIAIQTDFLDKLMDTIDRGIGTLVDADMTEASTRLKALQTQQQLGVQALSIANSSSQSLLSLFE